MSYKKYYQEQIRPKLIKELKIGNPFALPNLEKIVINVGVGEAAVNKKVLDNVVDDLTVITGQKPVRTKARKSISTFKIRRNMPIGVKVTLRGERMFDFLERLVKVVFPRVRDFSGVDKRNVDQHGNLNLGLTEQTLFPEVDYDKIDKLRGMQITLVTDSNDREINLKLFEMLGIKFAQ